MGNWKAAVAIQFYGGNLEVRVPAGIIERRQLLNTSLFRRHNFCNAQSSGLKVAPRLQCQPGL